jgi:RNAse (barnase) inhibitor barstar
MNIVQIDASGWRTGLDFYETLLAALGAPHGHGRNINALIDSMVYGGINAIGPPMVVRVTGTANLPTDARDELTLTILAFGEIQGGECDVRFEGTLP